MDVESISGANIYTIHQFLKDNKARVKKYTHLILHVGANDIGNGLCSKLIAQYYCNLLELITHNFSNINIIMSAILPRPIDFDTTKQLVIETNNCFNLLKHINNLFSSQVHCIKEKVFVKMDYI